MTGRGRRLRGAGLLACAAVLALPGAAAARTLEHKLVPASGGLGYTGFAADIDRDMAVVGAPLAGSGSGAVYVFERAGAGWTQTATLTASNPQQNAYLGFSVAVDGDAIVAGAPGNGIGGGGGTGRVYTFARTGAAQRTETAILSPSDPAADSALGFSVGIDGDTIVAGAPGSQSLSSFSGKGAVLTFSRTGAAARTETAKLSLATGPADDLLGWSVAIDGDTIVAGAPTISNFFVGGSDNAVYTFARTGAPTRNETARLTVAGGGAETGLGVSVAIDGDVIAAGAPFAPPMVGALAVPAGAVYTFARSGGPARTETATLTGSGGSSFGVYLGGGVDIDGDSIVAGAVDTDASFDIPTGAAYRFSRTGGPARTELERLHLPTGVYNFGFFYGSAVASSGGTIIVGAPFGSGAEGSEAAYVSGPETTITAGPADGSFTTDTTPSFAFEADVDTPTFECRVDTGDWASCTSPREIGPLDDGEHTFAVRATDQYGDTDPSPATRTFTVDTTPPDTTITAGPAEGSFTTDAAPTFEFSADEPATFECQVDTGDWASCASPRTIGPLTPGEHTFRVRATDRAGTVDPSPATRTFVVNRPPVAVADAYSAIGGGSLTVPAPGVLANDSDADGQTLTAQLVSAPAGGGLTLDPDGSLTYAVPDDVVGAVTFTYRAFDGFAYSDAVTVTITVRAGCDGVAATVTGTPGNDVISGTGGNDVITALGGNDTITPGSGVDRVCGGPGADTIDTGSDDDVARGGPGNDTIAGGSGDDALYGGEGNDRIDGGGDRDRLFGEAGIDRLLGGGDPDVLNGGADAPDACDGEGGSDSTTGGCETLTSVP